MNSSLKQNHPSSKEAIDFLTTTFRENDNSAKEYKQSLIEYLFGILENNNWEAMSEHQLYLNGAKKMITEIIEELNS